MATQRGSPVVTAALPDTVTTRDSKQVLHLAVRKGHQDPVLMRLRQMALEHGAVEPRVLHAVMLAGSWSPRCQRGRRPTALNAANWVLWVWDEPGVRGRGRREHGLSQPRPRRCAFGALDGSVEHLPANDLRMHE